MPEQETSKKQAPTHYVSSIKKGNTDTSGEKIIHVLASGNEFAIYEIEHPDINNRLKVLIDGHTDESENTLTEIFDIVKQDYIKAKGLLYRSPNFGMMKNRVAHALATCLRSGSDNKNIFPELITDIETEIKQAFQNRLFYLMPVFGTALLSLLYVIICLCLFPNLVYISAIIFTIALGCSLSVLTNMKGLHFEEYNKRWIYLIFGFERLFLSFVTGCIGYLLIRSKLLFPKIDVSDIWQLMPLITLSAFSERLIPNFLRGLDRKFKD